MNRSFKLMPASLLIILFVACGSRDKDRLVLDSQGDFYCEKTNEVAYRGWSEYGLMKVCLNRGSGLKDGSMFAAQSGKLRSKSLFGNGSEVRGWTWYDDDGNPVEEDGGYRPPLHGRR